jgi:hypothetical protein
MPPRRLSKTRWRHGTERRLAHGRGGGLDSARIESLAPLRRLFRACPGVADPQKKAPACGARALNRTTAVGLGGCEWPQDLNPVFLSWFRAGSRNMSHLPFGIPPNGPRSRVWRSASWRRWRRWHWPRRECPREVEGCRTWGSSAVFHHCVGRACGSVDQIRQVRQSERFGRFAVAAAHGKFADTPGGGYSIEILPRRAVLHRPQM